MAVTSKGPSGQPSTRINTVINTEEQMPHGSSTWAKDNGQVKTKVLWIDEY